MCTTLFLSCSKTLFDPDNQKGGGGGGGSTTCTITFWTAISTYSNFYVMCNNSTQQMTTYSVSGNSPGCGANGCASFIVTTPGTYTFSASANVTGGTATWPAAGSSNQIVIPAGQTCYTEQLQ